MNVLKITALLVFTLLFIRCDKDKTVDPQAVDPNTANSFSCYVNGVYWEAQAPFTWGGDVPLDGEYDESTGYLGLHSVNSQSDNNIYEYVNLYCFSLLNVGTFDLHSGDGTLKGYADTKGNHICNVSYHDTLNPGTINITKLDKSKRLIQGTFSMTLKNPDCGPDSLMYITNGKFMFNY